MFLPRYFGVSESKQDEAASAPPHDAEQSQTNEQMERVAKIMRAAAEGTIQMLSDIQNQ